MAHHHNNDDGNIFHLANKCVVVRLYLSFIQYYKTKRLFQTDWLQPFMLKSRVSKGRDLNLKRLKFCHDLFENAKKAYTDTRS